jgi:hypothetical protein
MRILHNEFGWEIAVQAGQLLARFSEYSVAHSHDLLSDLSVQIAKVPGNREQEFLSALSAFIVRCPESVVAAASAFPDAMRKLDPAEFQTWCASVGQGGSTLESTSAQLKGESEAGRGKLREAQEGTALQDVQAALSHYVQAHAGRFLSIDAHPGPSLGRLCFSCDNHRVYLPERIQIFGDERDALAYRVGAGIAAGFVETGSFDLDLSRLGGEGPERGQAPDGHDDSPLEQICARFILPGAAQLLFERLERVRVCAVLSQRYPGLGRDILLLKVGMTQCLGEGQKQPTAIDELLDQMDLFWISGDCADPLAQAWMKEAERRLKADQFVEATAELFLELAPKLMDLLEEVDPVKPFAKAEEMDLSRRRSGEKAVDRRMREIHSDLLEEDIQSRMESIRAVLEGRKPVNDTEYAEMEAFLSRNPPPDGGLVDQVERVAVEHQVVDGDEAALSAQGGFLYKEWDEEIGDYRPQWVRVVEHPALAGNLDFYNRTRAEQGRHIESLRRRFEALRPEAFRRVRAQLQGDALDLDRVISARIDHRAGRTPDERYYRQTRRVSRSVAVAFLVDLSSSTNEPARFGGKRIIDVEKEALLVTAEALDALGDSFAIYGFSGFSREEVAFYTAKEFETPYSDAVRAKIGGLTFKMENRDGAAIRHVGTKLLKQDAQTRVLFLLSDGKPLDCGCPQYKDEYAQGDTRMALRELRQKGIQALCVTVDPHGGDYLSELYGKGNYTVVDDVERLPTQLPQFYQRLTT